MGMGFGSEKEKPHFSQKTREIGTRPGLWVSGDHDKQENHQSIEPLEPYPLL
jgi:hypothetical protein